jgi:hypothetical protein
VYGEVSVEHELVVRRRRGRRSGSSSVEALSHKLEIDELPRWLDRGVRLRAIRLGDALAREIATPPAPASPMTSCRRRSGNDAPVVRSRGSSAAGAMGIARINDRCAFARLQAMRSGLERGEIGWRDLADFYAGALRPDL